jgi:hypothetical protein
LDFTATVAAGSDRVLYLGVCQALGTTNEMASAPTWNGDPMTLVGLAATGSGPSDKVVVYLYRRVAPDVGTLTVSIALTTGRRFTAGTLSLSGVHQSTPDDTPVTDANLADTDTVSVAVTTTAGDLVIDVGCKRGSNTALVMGTQANRVQRWANETTASSPSLDAVGGSSTRTGSGALTMDWSDGVGAYGVVGVNTNQLAAAPGRFSGGLLLLR